MKPRIKSDLKQDQILQSLETLRQYRKFFNCPRRILQKFITHCKFLAFSPKQQITKRNEPVDFFAIILKGELVQSLESHTQATLQLGDAIGYMSLVQLGGCEVQQFDTFAKTDGCLCLMRRDDFRFASKRDPEFGYWVMKLMSQHALNVVSHQYLNQDYYQSASSFVPLEASVKKVTAMLDHLAMSREEIEFEGRKRKKNEQPPPSKHCFRQYWQKLETRERRVLIQNSTLMELGSEQILVKANQTSDAFYILITGELVDFSKQKKGVVYRPGETVGLKEFLNESGFDSNIIARSKAMLLRISRSNMEDMFEASATSATQIYQVLTQWEAFQLRDTFEKEFPEKKDYLQKEVEELIVDLRSTNKPLNKKEQQPLKQLMNNYFEIDKQHVQKNTEDIQKNVVAPLYVLDVYKDLIAKRSYQSNEIKDRKDPMLETGLSVFLRDKAEEHEIAMRQQKREERQRKKKGLGGLEDEEEADEEDLMMNEYMDLKVEWEKAQEYIYLLEQEVIQLKDSHQENREEKERLQQMIRKIEMHKELLKLELASDDGSLTNKVLKQKKVSMLDTFKQQQQGARKFRNTVNAAEKLINLSKLHK